MTRRDKARATSNIVHGSIAIISSLASDILLSAISTPEQMARTAARALAKTESKMVVAVALIATPTVDTNRWRPLAIASSDPDLDLESPAILSLCSQVDLLDDIVDPRPHAYCRADLIRDSAWVNSEEATRRAAVGLHDYARAIVPLANRHQPLCAVFELAGRTTDWRPSADTLQRMNISASLTAAAYQYYILRPAEARHALDSKLTAAQRRVARLLNEDLSESQMAARLNRSVHTIHDHIKAIYYAWHVHSRAEAVWLRRHPLDDVAAPTSDVSVHTNSVSIPSLTSQ